MKTILAMTVILVSQFASAQATNGSSSFQSDGFGPPELSIQGESAKAAYNYLRTTEIDGPDLGMKSKAGYGVTCYQHVASQVYRCDFIFDSSGIITGGN